ncbi:Uncharacterised protein [Mycobacteroides abscessus subsp. abscessus]|nr:Uncharacterised protein [Mycobacteroides abscessus subsp. abscessus]
MPYRAASNIGPTLTSVPVRSNTIRLRERGWLYSHSAVTSALSRRKP